MLSRDPLARSHTGSCPRSVLGISHALIADPKRGLTLWQRRRGHDLDDAVLASPLLQPQPGGGRVRHDVASDGLDSRSGKHAATVQVGRHHLGQDNSRAYGSSLASEAGHDSVLHLLKDSQHVVYIYMHCDLLERRAPPAPGLVQTCSQHALMALAPFTAELQ